MKNDARMKETQRFPQVSNTERRFKLQTLRKLISSSGCHMTGLVVHQAAYNCSISPTIFTKTRQTSCNTETWSKDQTWTKLWRSAAETPNLEEPDTSRLQLPSCGLSITVHVSKACGPAWGWDTVGHTAAVFPPVTGRHGAKSICRADKVLSVSSERQDERSNQPPERL